MIEYYLIKDFDGNERMDVDLSDCPVDGHGNVDEKDAALAAIEQLGWIFCAKDK